MADNWLRHIQDVRDRHSGILDGLDAQQRADALCELNVIEQVLNVSQTTVLQDAWLRGQDVTVHGWIYGLHDGLLKDLKVTVEGNLAIEASYARALASVSSSRAGSPTPDAIG